ncbi:MAG: helix-turn-helix domain-containing protein [Balneolaceae bacterium]
MSGTSFDVRRYIANQPIDKELFKYKKSLYPAHKLGIANQYGKIHTYILDWQQGTYAYLSDSLQKTIGYDDDFHSQGLDAFFKIIHPDDREPMQRIIAKWMEVLLGKPEEEFNRYTANFNYRLKKESGGYLNFLQQPVYVSFDKKGNMIYEAGILADLTRYRNDGNISLVIFDPDHQPILEYYPKEDFMPLIGATRQKMVDIEKLISLRGDNWLRNVQKIILDNIDNDTLNVEFICRELSVSKSDLYRKLESASGFRPARLIRLIRLHESLTFLSSSDHTISEIAYQLGFRTHSYFTSCFQKQFNCTPSEYRTSVQ